MYTNIKLMIEPLSSINTSADRLVNLMTRHTKIVMPTYNTYLKVTSVDSGHRMIPKNLFLIFIDWILGNEQKLWKCRVKMDEVNDL